MEINDLITIMVEQNKSFIEQNNSYKDMLFWAVTSIITILVLFLAANFYTMKKLRDEEIEGMQAKVLQNFQNNSVPEFKKELNTHLELLVSTKIKSLESEISNLKTQLETTKINHSGLANHYKKGTLRLEGMIHSFRGDFYTQGEYYSNAFLLYLAAGNFYIEAGSIGELNAILRYLEKTAEKLPYVMSEVTDFHIFSSKLSSEFQPHASKIADILKGKKPLGS